MSPENRNITVTVVGGGIAGLTAALRLSERGYAVRLYEAKPVLGGNLASFPRNGVYHDVYSHMFSTWYRNFWTIVEHDLGLDRATCFEPRDRVNLLRKGATGYEQIRNVGSVRDAWSNLMSGVEPAPDMFVWNYSMLDLLAHTFRARRVLSQNSVNGFMDSRAYSTRRAASLHDLILMIVWSSHSDLTAASSYREFIKYSYRTPAPMTWLLRGNLHDRLLKPLEDRLRSNGCEIRTGTSVTGVHLTNGRVDRIELQDAAFMATHEVHPIATTAREEPVDYLVLAVPPAVLHTLISTGEPGHRIVDQLPALSQVRRLHSEPIPVLDVYFKRKLPGIPKEHVALRESKYDLTFLDLSQLWSDDPNMRGITALTVAASDFEALPSANPRDDAFTMLTKLHGYISVFEPGRAWGDPESDIDWDKSSFQTNLADQLFINEVGSEQWRPHSSYTAVPNLFFAGDFCRTAIDMTTVEAAVTSGLEAARALWLSLDPADRRGNDIVILSPDRYSEGFILATKLLLAPYAYAAGWWSRALDAMPALARGQVTADWMSQVGSLAWMPYAYAADWLQTAWTLWDDVFLRGRGVRHD